jgi:hypothetical protein
MKEMPGFNKQNSQSGQALVEYVLLLAVAVTLILGLMTQIYRPFGDWLNNYMGAYLECLLDAGELPTFGQNAGEGVCASEFKAFTPGSGRPPDPNARRNGSNDRDREPQAQRERIRNANEDGGGGSGASNSGGSGRSNRSFSTGAQGGADGLGSQGDQVMVERLPRSRFFRLSSGGSGSAVNSAASGSGGEVMTVPLGQTRGREKKKEKKLQVQADVGAGNNSAAKKLTIKPTERKTASTEEDIEKWSFAQYLKIAVIVAIIIAIVLFLGGQILQISKSMEK